MNVGKLLIALSAIAGFAIFAAIAQHVDIKSIFQTIQLLSFEEYLMMLGFYMILFTISLARWGLTIRAFGGKIPFLKLLSYRLTEWATGYITPFSRLGGEPVMAYLLKKYGGLKYRKGIPIIVINKMFDFAAGITLAFIGLAILIIAYWDDLAGRTILWLLAALLTLGFLIYKFYYKTLQKQGFFTTLLSPFKELIPHKKLHSSIKIVEANLIEFFRKNKQKLAVLAIISLIFQILMLVEYKIIGIFLGMNLSLIHLMIINVMLILAFLIPTPGSLGGMEGALAFAFSLFAIGASKGFAFSLALRSVEVTLTIIGLIFAYYYGVRSVKKAVEEKF
jgi:uncharacterized protein (TIRG00374 family)